MQPKFIVLALMVFIAGLAVFNVMNTPDRDSTAEDSAMSVDSDSVQPEQSSLDQSTSNQPISEQPLSKQPKAIIDNVTNELDKAQQVAAERLAAAEGL